MRTLRRDGVTYLILACGVFLLFVAVYIPVQRTLTQIRCVNAGYPTSYWTYATSGVCSKLENGNTVIVHVDSLR